MIMRRSSDFTGGFTGKGGGGLEYYWQDNGTKQLQDTMNGDHDGYRGYEFDSDFWTNGVAV